MPRVTSPVLSASLAQMVRAENLSLIRLFEPFIPSHKKKKTAKEKKRKRLRFQMVV